MRTGFFGIGESCYLWSTEEDDESNKSFYSGIYSGDELALRPILKGGLFSVRCVKDYAKTQTKTEWLKTNIRKYFFYILTKGK